MRADDAVRPWKLLDVQTIGDKRGKLQVLEPPALPFVVQRVFWVHDVPDGMARGAHAHREQHQIIVCMHGSVRVRLETLQQSETVTLDSPDRALYIPPLVWAEQYDIEGGAAYVVLASAPFDEADYVRSHDEFLRAARN